MALSGTHPVEKPGDISRLPAKSIGTSAVFPAIVRVIPR
jgi:hypothetical protein